MHVFSCSWFKIQRWKWRSPLLFSLKGLFGKYPKTPSFPLKRDHALFRSFSTITLGVLRNTRCCVISSNFSSFISKWLPGQSYCWTSHQQVSSLCRMVCAGKKAQGTRVLPAVPLGNLKTSQVSTDFTGRSVIYLFACRHCTLFIFFQRCINLVS